MLVETTLEDLKHDFSRSRHQKESSPDKKMIQLFELDCCADTIGVNTKRSYILINTECFRRRIFRNFESVNASMLLVRWSKIDLQFELQIRRKQMEFHLDGVFVTKIYFNVACKKNASE